LVLSLEYERPLFVKTKNLFLKFLNPNLLRPWARFINILMKESQYNLELSLVSKE